MPRWGNILFLCTLTVLAGCRAAGDSPQPVAGARRDSAGIEIVENALPAGGTRTAFIVEPNPAIEIGTRDGPPEYLLSAVRGAFRLADGRIVIGEGDAKVRYFDAAGRHIRTLNLRGEGPGEVASIRTIVPHRSDSILVTCCTGGISFNSRELAGKTSMPINWSIEAIVYDSAGRMGRRATIKWPAAPARVGRGITMNGDPWISLQGVAGDGSYITRGSTWAVLKGSPGQIWLPVPYFRVSADGARADTMIVLPATDREETDAGKDEIPHFYRNAPQVALDGRWMYWGNGESFEIHTYDVVATAAPGKPSRIVRYALPNRSMVGALRNAYNEFELRTASSAADSARMVERRKTEAARATLPAYDAFRLDAHGNLWVMHARLTQYPGRPFDRNEQQTWTVFSPTGDLLGDVLTPTGLEMTQVGDGWLLGLWKDEDDVERVRMYRMQRR